MRKSVSLLVCMLMIVPALLRGQSTDFSTTDFTKADSIGRLYPKHSLKDLKALSFQLTESLPTQQEKFRAIFRWVCENIENDYPAYNKNKIKRNRLRGEELTEWNRSFSKAVYQTLIERQKTVCTGYAYLISKLAAYAGIQCHVINGYGRTAESGDDIGLVNHAWNAVSLDSKWYLCDPTWGAGVYDVRNFKYIRRFNESYFLSNPEIFIRNHYPADSNWMLVKHKPSLQQFFGRPIIYQAVYKNEIIEYSRDSFAIKATKGSNTRFGFTTRSTPGVSKMEIQIAGKKFDVPFTVSGANSVGMNYTFTARGRYDVHVLMNEEYVCSYNVLVR